MTHKPLTAGERKYFLIIKLLVGTNSVGGVSCFTRTVASNRCAIIILFPAHTRSSTHTFGRRSSKFRHTLRTRKFNGNHPWSDQRRKGGRVESFEYLERLCTLRTAVVAVAMPLACLWRAIKKIHQFDYGLFTQFAREARLLQECGARMHAQVFFQDGWCAGIRSGASSLHFCVSSDQATWQLKERPRSHRPQPDT